MPGRFFKKGAFSKLPLQPSSGLWSSPSFQPLFLTDGILKKYDVDGSGSLQINDLSALLQDAFPSNSITDADVKTIVEKLDIDSSGTVGSNELRAFLRLYNPQLPEITTKSALVVVDVQNDFINGSLAYKYSGVEIIPTINLFRDKFDVVVIAYDWHPFDHCSFVETVSEGKIPIKEEVKQFDPFTPVTLSADEDREEHTQMLYPRHAVQNTDGAKCHKDLVLKDSDLVCYKGTKVNLDAYSVFYDKLKANDTGLMGMLEKEGVTDVYCCGLVLDICVKASALHGAEGGFRVFVIDDACKSLNLDSVAASKEELASAGVGVISSTEAIAKVSGSKSMSFEQYLAAIKGSAGAQSVHKALEEKPQHGSSQAEVKAQ